MSELDVYYFSTERGFLNFDTNGWLRPVPSSSQATHFQEGWHDGNMFIKVVSGQWDDGAHYIGGDWDKGVGAWKWDDCGYMKWDNGRLQSQSGKTSGHHLVYRRSNGFFYFYDDGDCDYEPVTLTKIRPFYRIQLDCRYAQFNPSGWLALTDHMEDATLFRDYENQGKMAIRIASGAWCGKYLGGDWDKGVGAYKWDDCGYMKWEGGRLQSQSGKTSGHYLVFRNSNGFFYFFNDGCSSEYDPGASKNELGCQISHS